MPALCAPYAITISWASHPASDGRYVVGVAFGKGQAPFYQQVHGCCGPITVGVPDACRTYYYQVAALPGFQLVEEGYPQSVRNAIDLREGSQSAQTNGQISVNLAWTKACGCLHQETIVDVTRYGQPWPGFSTRLSPGTSSVNIRDLDPGRDYVWRVRDIFDYGTEYLSGDKMFRTIDAARVSARNLSCS